MYTLIKAARIPNSQNSPIKFKILYYQKDIDRLNEPLRALAAYYSALLGSNCIDSEHLEICELTTALGLKYQGSEEYLKILAKWYPNNTKVKRMIDEHCFVIAPGASMFSDLWDLNFTVKHDTVFIAYRYSFYDHGKSSFTNGKDIAVIKHNEILFLNRRR